MTKNSKANKIIELVPENKSLENSEKKIDNPLDKLISQKNQDLLTRIGVYSLNIGSRYLSETFKATVAIENFYDAIFFAGLDVIARKNSKFKRLVKSGGYLFYVGSCGYDLISGSNDFENIWSHLGNFALDVSMAYRLGTDMRSLYKELKKGAPDEKSGLRKDLESIISFIKKKFEKESKSSGENVSQKKEDSKSKFKEYLSNFGKGIGQGFGYGMFAGYSFGKSAFEKLKENYSIYKTKRKESNKLKKIKDEEIKTQRAEQKIKNAGFEKVSINKKKEILEYLDERGKNPNLMKNYEIENAYGDFKQKQIKEQIQIMTEKKNYFETNLKQMKSVSWSKRFWNSSEISYTKKSLKQIEEILRKLDIEEKNPPRAPAMTEYLKKREGEEKDGKQNS